jgi:hypothetical protein
VVGVLDRWSVVVRVMDLNVPMNDIRVVVAIGGAMDVLGGEHDQAKHTACAQNGDDLSAKAT